MGKRVGVTGGLSVGVGVGLQAIDGYGEVARGEITSIHHLLREAMYDERGYV